MPITGTLSAEQRRSELTARVAAHGDVRIEDAARELGVSEMTIRRDLAALEAAGEMRRVRGGAVRASGPRPFDERRASGRAAKTRIAQKVRDLVPMTGTIAFDASTTVATLAGMLGPREDLTVLTNAIQTMSALVAVPGVTPLLLGGQPDPRTGSLVGPLACRSAGELFTELFVASSGGVDPASGASEASLEEAEVKRVLAARTRRTVLCVDASKLGTAALARSLDLEDVAILVTDLDPADAALDPYRELVEVR